MTQFTSVGRSVPRLDALEKVTGKARYSADLTLPGMLHIKVLRSPHPHARIISIDTSRAEGMRGVKLVVTGQDVPEERLGLIRDRPVLARDIVRFAGDGVAAVAAETIEAADEALDLIDVVYQPLPAIFDPEEAMGVSPPVVVHPGLFQYDRSPFGLPLYRFEPDRPNVYVHHQVRRGDVDAGFHKADLVLENRFTTARMQHCPLETHNAVARLEPDGGLTVWTSTGILHRHKADLARLFGLPPSKVRAISLYVGGNYGGKSASSEVVPYLTALVALRTGRPARLAFSRDEEFIDGTSREAMTIDIKDGFSAEGNLLAREMKLVLNGGGYSGHATLIAKNAIFGAIGTYRTPSLRLDSYAVATNEPPCGPLAGFGSAEVVWAIESNLEMAAARLGIDPVELRRRNLLSEGDEDACGMTTHSIGARECLEKVAQWVGWGEPLPDEGLVPNGVEGRWRRGRGIALGNKYTEAGSASVAAVKVREDASIEIRHSAIEMGQGCNTVLAQIAAEEFGTTVDRVRVIFTDTAITPYDAATVSSRTTYYLGNAVRLACADAKRQIFDMVAAETEVPHGGLTVRDGVVYTAAEGKPVKTIRELFSAAGYLLRGGEIASSATYNGPRASEDMETGQGKRRVSYYSHGACAAEVAVNIDTGEVRVLRIGTCWDMGQPINPRLCESQMEFGIGMGIGSALFEELVLEKGIVRNPNFKNYRLPVATEIPSGDDVASMMAPAPHREGPFGAKGMGEGVMVVVAPAIGNAVYHAVGVRVKDLPVTRERVLRAIDSLVPER